MLTTIIYCTLLCLTPALPGLDESSGKSASTPSQVRQGLDEQAAWEALNAVTQSHTYPERGPLNRQPRPDHSRQQAALEKLLGPTAGTSAEPHVMFHLAATLYNMNRFADAMSQFDVIKNRFPKHGLCIIRDLSVENSLSLVMQGIEDCAREIEVRKNYEVKELLVAKLDPSSKAVFHTSLGDFEMMFYTEAAPATVANMKKLIKSGYFIDSYVHEVHPLRNFELGCPNTNKSSGVSRDDDGLGGPDYDLPLEFSSAQHEANAVSMVAVGGTGRAHGSQFVVCVNPQPQFNRTQAVFAKIITGMDVIKNISKQVADGRNNPYERIWIQGTEWIENPK